MTTTLFCMPLKKGKTEVYKAFMQECVGPKKEEYQALLMRYALNNTRLWIHTIDGKDYALFTHDMDDNAGERFGNWPNKDIPFELWFYEQLTDCYDLDMDQMPPHPTFITYLESKR